MKTYFKNSLDHSVMITQDDKSDSLNIQMSKLRFFAWITLYFLIPLTMFYVTFKLDNILMHKTDNINSDINSAKTILKALNEESAIIEKFEIELIDIYKKNKLEKLNDIN